MARKLRTVTKDDTLGLDKALAAAKMAAYLLRRSGASRKLVLDMRSMVKRVEGARRHAIRARFLPVPGCRCAGGARCDGYHGHAGDGTPWIQVVS